MQRLEPPAISKKGIVKTAPKETEFTERDYTRFRDLVRMRSGIYFGERKRNDLKSGVLKAFHYSGMHLLSEYYDALANGFTHSTLFKTLISFLTVGETYFFRHFDVIEKEILPRLVKAHHHDKSLRIWSAGCSTGEEPYTVAMVLHSIIPDLKNWSLTIVGTDINVNSLSYAKEGIYRPWSLRSIPDSYKNKYFTKKEGLYYLNSEIRSMVRFDYLNLVEECYPAADNMTMDLDMILCRNVTIYFEAQTTIQVINRFYDALKERSYLAVGHAEPSSLIYDAYVPEIYPDAVLYRRDSAAKRDLHYKTGIRIRRETMERVKPAYSKSIAPHLEDLQKQLKKMQDDFVAIPKPEPSVIRKKLTQKSEEISPKIVEETDKRRGHDSEAELFAKGIELFTLKDFKGSLDHFLRLLEDYPSNGRAAYMVAHIHANLDNVAVAKEYCYRAIHLDSLLLEAYYLLGLIFKEEKNFDESIKMLKKAIYIEANFAVGYYELAVNYFKLEDTVQARKHLKQTESILKSLPPDERVGVLDDLTARELRMMVSMWDK
ncbi:hypothetical protein HUU42_09235 [bacterium]|nr:hypothetical protein [bacterium]